MEMALETRELGKSYDGRKVVDNLSVSVPVGSIFGLVGSNGAGKSTLMRMLVGITRPDGGDAFLLGRSIREKDGSIRARVGYVPDVPVLYPSFSVADMYQLSSRLYPHWDGERCRELHRQFALPAGSRIRQLSRGEKVQVSLVLALSLRPRLLLLDEPTAGLDPVVRRAFLHTIIDEVAQRGTTVFYSTHNLNDLEQSADHIASLWQGQLLFSSSLDELKESLYRLRLVWEKDPPAEQEIAELPGFIDQHRNGRVLTLTMRGDWEEVRPRLTRWEPMLAERVDLSLEDIFVALMKEKGYSYEKMVLANHGGGN